MKRWLWVLGLISIVILVVMFSFLSRGSQESALAAPQPQEDCIGYNPQNLSIMILRRSGVTSYIIRDGDHWIVDAPTFVGAMSGMEYMSNFNTICYEGRGTNEIKSWFELR
jgi:hypothetical protein